jgi:hypothetical protein
MIQSLNYFYDRQQARFLEQVIRAFSGFQYMTGSTGGNPPMLQQVPCRMASTNMVTASIMSNQSTNSLLTTPMITVWQNGLALRNDALQNRAHVDTRQVVERQIDPETGEYTANRGQGYTVKRLMPIPLEMRLQVDVWTSNLDQKYQLEEQILTIMCPSFDIQNSDNALDWTALTTVFFEEITHTSRNVPVGNNDEIDVMSFGLRLPIWLSPPAIITQQTVIQQIVTNISDLAPLPGVIGDQTYSGELYKRVITTPNDAHIQVTSNSGLCSITLLGPKGSDVNEKGESYSWMRLINQYGELRPASSQLALNTTSNFSNGTTLVGTIQLDPNNSNKLIWQIDPSTMPANSLPSVNAVIDPLRSFPGSGLPSPSEGDRYLILNDIGPSQAWGNILAYTNDIIQYQNGAWIVSFSSMTVQTQQYVLNLNKSMQLKWTGNNAEGWVLAIDGRYGPGFWRLEL